MGTMIATVLAPMVIALVINSFYQSEEIKRAEKRLKENIFAPPTFASHRTQMVKIMVGTKVDPMERKHLSASEVKEKVRRRLAEEISERIVDYACIITCKEQCIVGEIETVKAYFTIADMSDFGEPYFKEKK